MANTTNLNLKKPLGTEQALIADINGNMDILDSTIGAPSSASAVSGANAFAKINTVNSKISAYLKSGTNNIGRVILSGYITGSGNYIDVFLPLNTSGKTVTSVTAVESNETRLFTVDGTVSFSSAPTISLVEKTNFGLRLEIALPSTQTPNRTATIYLILTIVCS